MPEYQYRCLGCKLMFVTLSRTEIPPCPVCGHRAQRNYSFYARASLAEHFNHSVGTYVANERELRDAFKRASDEASERTGSEHNYEYLSRAEMADPRAHGVTDEGLDDTRRATHEPR